MCGAGPTGTGAMCGAGATGSGAMRGWPPNGVGLPTTGLLWNGCTRLGLTPTLGLTTGGAGRTTFGVGGRTWFC